MAHHHELLDASHIVANRDEGGEPTVTNAVSLRKIHHIALDRNLIGARRDGVTHVRGDIPEARDDPMLQHGLQGLYMERLHMPGARRDRPDPERVARRFEEFLEAQEPRGGSVPG